MTDVALAFPLAYYLARVVTPRFRSALLIAIVMPLWVSYLVRVFAWRLILTPNGFLNWLVERTGIGSLQIGNSKWALWLVFTYLWLPFMVLPIYTSLERIPESFLEASGDLGGRGWITFRRVVWPLAFPAIVAGSIFTFSLTLGDYIAPSLVANTKFIGNVIFDSVGVANNLPLGAAFAVVPVVIMAVYLLVAKRLGRVRGAVGGAMESRGGRVAIRICAWLVIAFVYVPLLIVALYAFSGSVGQKWPIEEYTTRWFGVAWRNGVVREAVVTSVEIALIATVLALILGSLAAFAVHRFSFFGRNVVSLVLVLPIALPGIVTAMALNSVFVTADIRLSLFTIFIGHSVFCIVVIYNNVIARLRRTPTSLVEASMDLGADGWQTFRHVTLPAIRTALVAGALLAFALSFDEIVVTNFVAGSEITLPKFIFNNLRQPRSRPIVNVVAIAVVLLSIIPVYLAQRLSGGPDALAAAAKQQSGAGG